MNTSLLKMIMRNKRHKKVYATIVLVLGLRFKIVQLACGAASGGSSKLKRQKTAIKVLKAELPAAALRRAAQPPVLNRSGSRCTFCVQLNVQSKVHREKSKRRRFFAKSAKTAEAYRNCIR